MIMKYIAYLVVPLILISLYGGCSDECVNCGPPLPGDCTSIQDIIESQCLGETVSNLCLGMSCDTDPPVFVPIGTILHCDEIDCSSMQCGDVIFTDLNSDEENLLTTTVIDNGVDLGNASCVFFQN
jgi:hypothetical protein